MRSREEINMFDIAGNDTKPMLFIANAGLNHGGSKEKALAMVRAAKWAGADAIKFPMFKLGRTPRTEEEGRVGGPGVTEEPFELGLDVLRILCKEASRLGIGLLSTPLDEESADLLEEAGVRAFEICEDDTSRSPLVKSVARKDLPILVPTWRRSIDEIETTIDWIRSESNCRIVLMHREPFPSASPDRMNLKSIQWLRDWFDLTVGFSDQTQTRLAAIVAVSLGAQVIERHFMLDTRNDVPDREVSLDTKQLRTHIAELRAIGGMMGKAPAPNRKREETRGFDPHLYDGGSETIRTTGRDLHTA